MEQYENSEDHRIISALKEYAMSKVFFLCSCLLIPEMPGFFWI